VAHVSLSMDRCSRDQLQSIEMANTHASIATCRAELADDHAHGGVIMHNADVMDGD
jgi:hypothetical protein